LPLHDASFLFSLREKVNLSSWENEPSFLSLSSHLLQDEHVLALLVGDPIDGLLHLLRLVHALQVLLQDLLVDLDLGRVLAALVASFSTQVFFLRGKEKS